MIAEQLSAAGVPVLMADVKGDLSGLSRPGEPGDQITQRATDTGDDWAPTAFPVEFLSLGTGGQRRAGARDDHQLRADPAVEGAGAQRHSGIDARADLPLGRPEGLPLLDLKDLRAVIMHLTSDEGKADLRALGGVSKATAGVILRAVTNLDAEGGDTFFGEPELEPDGPAAGRRRTAAASSPCSSSGAQTAAR